MSNYTKTVNFATKDNLSPGNPLKIVKGTEIDTEYNNIATAVATKTDNSAAAITGGTITGITDLAVADGGTGASTAAGALNNLLPSQTSNANKYLQTDGTNATWDAVSLSTADITGTLAVANGGTGVTSSTGTVAVVLSNSPTLVTPALGTPSAAVLTNATGLPISTGVSGLGAGVATLLATPSSANLSSAITDETGSGSLVFATSPTLVTPILGTPTSGTLTNATGLPISTGVSGLGTGVATFLATPSSANLISAVTDETGTGSLVFATSPTLVTPILGTPTSATLTNATGLPLSTGITGTLPVANGGTGQTSYTDGQLLIGNTTGNTLTKATLTAGSGITVTNSAGGITIASTGGGSGTVTSASVVSANGFAGTVATATTTPAITLSTSITGVIKGNGTAISAATAGTDYVTPTGTETLTNKTLTSPILTTPQLGTPSSGTLTNATGLPLTTGVTGTLPVANGGTGSATLTANNVLLGNGTSAVQAVAPSTTGNVLTSNGTTWVSSAPAGGSTANLQTFTSSGTWTKPSGVTFVRVCVWGGGGGGGSGRFTTCASDAAGGAGGGGGARASLIFAAACLTSTVTVTIGAGGAGGAARTSANCGADGSAGGTSMFGTGNGYIKAFGGGGGSLGSCDTVNKFGGGGGGTGGTGGTGCCVTNAAGGFPRSKYNGFAIANTCLRSNAIGGGGGAGGGRPCACITLFPGNAEFGGGGGGRAGRNNGNGGAGAGSLFGGTGGGGGGMATSCGTSRCAGFGGTNKYCAGGGAAGNVAGSILPSGSGGGGGGASPLCLVGRTGAAGATYGGGGGGGSGGRTTTSGAGGAGGGGGIKVYSW